VVDQAALHGLLKKVRDLGMPLLSVMRVTPGQAEASDVNETHHYRSKKRIEQNDKKRRTEEKTDGCREKCPQAFRGSVFDCCFCQLDQ